MPPHKCITIDPKKVKNLGPPRSQGFLGICYSVTAAMALEQLVCREKQADCSRPEDRVALMDLLRSYGDGKLIEAGSSGVALTKIRQQKFVVKEQCAPFSLEKTSQNGELARIEKLYLNQLKEGSSQKRASLQCNLTDQLSNILQLQISKEEITAVLTRDLEFNEFLLKISIPRECDLEKNKIRIMPFGLNMIPSEDKIDEQTVKKYLTENLSHNRPIIWNHCNVFEDGKCMSLHSNLIVGAKTECCNQNAIKSSNLSCRLLIQMRDPWPSPQNNPMQERWLDFDQFMEMTKRFSGQALTITENGKSREFHNQFISVSR